MTREKRIFTDIKSVLYPSYPCHPSSIHYYISFFAFSAPLRDVFILFVLLNFPSFAQQYTFKNYTVAHGLGSPSVNHIFQDSRGYIWFATQGGGASRFNGREFKNFTKADGLVNNDVTYITEDGSGDIWIGTASGASKFDGTSFRSFSAQEGLTDGIIFAVYPDTDGKIWFATSDRGISVYDGAKFDSLTIKDGFPSRTAYCIAKDRNGNYWFGLSDGIVKYRDGSITCYFETSDNIEDNDSAFFSAMLDSSGNVWVGRTSKWVVVIDTHGRMQKIHLPSPVQNDFIGGMTQDQRGNIWLATEHGLLKYDGKKFKLFSERDGFSVNIAQAVMRDYEGNIWAGTLEGGVNLLVSEAFVRYTNKHGLTSRNITCIHPDAGDSSYYIGTGEGAYAFNPENEAPFKKISGIADLENAKISSLAVDKRGRVWLTANGCIFIIEKKINGFALIKKYEQIDGKDLISPGKIIHDSKGNTCVATFGSGILFISESEVKFHSVKNGLVSDNIITVFEDTRSNIWIGTYDAGVIKFDGETFSEIPLNWIGADKSVWAVAEDKSGNIYLGTGESGLFRFDGKKISACSGHGLESESIKTLSWDERGNCLWLASETGLKKIIFTDDHQIEKIKEYKDEDGFSAGGANHDALRIDKNGVVWIGTVDGLWRFNRDDDSPKNIAPKIQLTDIRLFYQKTDWKKSSDSIDKHFLLPLDLQLPYSKNHLTFDIQALTTRDVQYTFMLEGQDENWAAPTNQNEITYSNISPGDYSFKAKAVGSDREVGGETIAFSFIVNPPWWGTWWFRSAAFLAAIGSLIAFIKTRGKILREQNLKLEETVKQRTSEIAHQKEIIENTLIEKEGLLHEKEILLKEIHHRVKNNLQTISSMLMLQSAGLKDDKAKAAIAESQSRVRSIALVHQKLYQTDGLEKVELNSFVKDLTAQVKSLYHQQAKQVAIHCDIPETYILIDTSIPLGLILNELLTNSFKYAFNKINKGEISIELNNLNADPASMNDNKMKIKKVKLTYRDNGPGFDFHRVHREATTLGIRLISLLSEQIGAALEYSNSNRSEFIFTFEINI